MTWKTVVIGASTGGVEALAEVLGCFPSDCPPTLVVQHIGKGFHAALADRLDRMCSARVLLAEHRSIVRPGLIQIAPDPETHLVLSPNGQRCHLIESPSVSGHRPSVDMLFNSAAQLGRGAVGVLLTGMGRDGANGMLKIRQSGGRTIAQDQKSSVVYGMPRIADEIGAVSQQIPLHLIGPTILKVASGEERASGHA